MKIHPMDSYFGEAGLLSTLEGFEYRPQQAMMARKTWDLLQSGEGKVLAIEAPTGIGKSFALLVPAILWALEGQRRILFLTAGHTLQEQLVSRDLPFLRGLLPSLFDFGTLKGRGNYLCLRRSLELESGGFLSFGDGGATSRDIIRWKQETKTGDLSELDIPEDHPVLGHLSASREGCLGKLCPHREECLVQRLYQEAHKWQVLVANYHLFFSHLDGGDRAFPVPFDALLCDEAHRIPEAARSAAARSASPDRFRRVFSSRNLNSLEKSFQEAGLPSEKLQAEWKGAVLGIERIFNRLSLLPREQWTFRAPLAELRYDLEDCISPVVRAAERILSCAAKEKPNEEGASAKAEGAAAASQILEGYEDLAWCLDVVRYPDWATWWDGARIVSAPVLAGPPVREVLSTLADIPIVCTSATLAIGGDFDFWGRETGIDPEEQVILDSPFDLSSQMSIWVVELGLKVTDPGYDARVCRVVDKLCDDNGGRTLVLCSSRRLVEAVSKKMKQKSRGYRVLCQGEAPKGELLNLFRKEESSVLIGSLSFREGIDIPGDGLTQVILDRIPFPHPEDPLVKARREIEGRKAFLKTTLPMSRLFLRQSFGRLIRRKTDRGCVVILDGRALERPDWLILQDFQGVPVKRIRLSSMP